MSETRPQSSGAQRVTATVLVLLLVVVVVAGVFFLVHWTHAKKVKAERDKYRGQAEFYCGLTGVAPQDAGFKRCVEDQIDMLVGPGGE